MNLKRGVVSGFIWTVSEKFGSLLIQFCVQIVLARLLLPEIFGLVAMLNIFVVIGSSFVDSGFSQALIQKQEVKRIDLNSVFYLNIAVSFILYFLLFAFTHKIAIFFNAPQLTKIAPILFLVLPINALSMTQVTILTKKMSFKIISKCNLLASTFAGITAITFALLGYGIWALVANMLTLYVVRVLMLWIYSEWRPAIEFSTDSIKRLFKLGSRLFATGLITNTFNNLAHLLIGKMYNPTQLGLFSQSLKYKELSAQAIALPVQNVTFPAFALLQEEDEKLLLSSRKVINVLSFILFPAMIGFMLVAEEAFFVAFREKWMAAVPYFKILCISALFMPLTNISQNIMKAKGRGNLILTLELIKKAFALVVILYAASVSVIAIAWAYLAWMGFEMVVNLIFVRRVINYNLKEQLIDTLPYLALTAAMSCVASLTAMLIGENVAPLTMLLVKTLVGITTYCSLAYIFKPQAFGEVLEIVKDLKRRLG